MTDTIEHESETLSGAYAGKKRVAVYVTAKVHSRLKVMSVRTATPIVHLVEAWIEEKVEAWGTERQAQQNRAKDGV